MGAPAGEGKVPPNEGGATRFGQEGRRQTEWRLGRIVSNLRGPRTPRRGALFYDDTHPYHR